MLERVETWCFEELNKLLGSPSEEIVRYILDINNQDELEEFLEDLFGHLSAEVREKFMADLLSVRKETAQKNMVSNVRQESLATAYRKPPQDQFSSIVQVLEGINQGSSKSKHRGKKSKAQPEDSSTSGNPHLMLDPLISDNNAQTQADSSPNSLKSGKPRRSGNFVPLYDHSQVVLLSGRHPCLCQASEHALINNCIQCGRIVCAQEGSGSCFTCSALVCTPEEQEILNRNSRKSEKLLNQLTAAHDQELLRRAVEHKNKLLEYNITSAQRTKVIDDESDYFSLASNKWITKEERKVLEKKAKNDHDQKHASRFGSSYKVSLDLDGRKVTLDDGHGKGSPKLQDLQAGLSNMNLSTGHHTSQSQPSYVPDNDQDVHPFITVAPPLYEPGEFSTRTEASRTEETLQKNLRLQDRELQELSDQGYCLSMHQPWASLLVRGIKAHEGRTWYTAYRGPLWIHAGSKPPATQDISEAEKLYRLLYPGKDLDFPKHYPTSCLLGCVNLVECLQQENYRTQYPDGESASPYVFICDNPQELIIKIPMSGKYKIFKLDKNLHKTVKKTLRKLN